MVFFYVYKNTFFRDLMGPSSSPLDPRLHLKLYPRYHWLSKFNNKQHGIVWTSLKKWIISIHSVKQVSVIRYHGDPRWNYYQFALLFLLPLESRHYQQIKLYFKQVPIVPTWYSFLGLFDSAYSRFSACQR